MDTNPLNNPILIFILTAILLLVFWNIYLHLQFQQTKKKLKVFFAGKRALDLEGVLFEEIKRLKQSEIEIKKIIGVVKKLKETTGQSIQKVGVVRFNPFKEMGSDQSFAIALLNGKNNGLVISSLYAREGVRIYCKPIENNESQYTLSKEEDIAIKKATGSD